MQVNRYPAFLVLVAFFLVLLGNAPRTHAQDERPSSALQASQHQVFLPVASGAPAQTTSESLVERAIENGTLDAETGILYRVYAAFGDPRLPAIYQGMPNSEVSTALQDAAHVYATLQPATQQLLEPFFLRPDAEGSWERQQHPSQRAAAQEPPLWATTCQTSANIKVWYHPRNDADAATARTICELIDGTIWPKLTGFMGRAPLSDAGEKHNGGDERFDIYLVQASSETVPPRTRGICAARSAYMLVNRSGFTRSQLAELLMRGILFGYPAADCDEYAWFFTATSVWARDYVFPTDNSEHQWGPAFLNTVGVPLNSFGAQGIGATKSSVRGGYLWPFYLDRVLGQPALIRQVWEKGDTTNSLKVINDLLPGNFKEQYPKFNLANWNRAPSHAYAVDSFTPGLKPTLEQEARLDNQPVKRIIFDGAVPYLAAHSFHFTFTDPKVRGVLFQSNYGLEDQKTAHIDALIKIGGTWTQEDWSDMQPRRFCRDLVAERVEELVVIVNNTEFEDRHHTLSADGSPELALSDMGCRGWQLSVLAETKHKGMWKNQQTLMLTTATLMRAPRGPDIAESYYVQDGTVVWSHHGTSGTNCVGERENVTFNINEHRAPLENEPLWVLPYGYEVFRGGAFTGTRMYLLNGSLQPEDPQTVTYVCKNETFTESINTRWVNAQALGEVVEGDGQNIAGSYTTSHEVEGYVTTETYDWTLTALPPE